MSIKDTDFIGFQYNQRHSSEFKIMRISDGSRYNDALIPTFQDKTVQIPGQDGTLYWESFYNNRTFTIQIAFDDLSEAGLQEMRAWLHGKDVAPLIFDESPYKVYSAKIQSPPQLKYICFERGGQRVYKGEGTIQFVCYYPYAVNPPDMKFLAQYNESIYPNKGQWAEASKIPATSTVTVSGVAYAIDVPQEVGTEGKYLILYSYVGGYLPTTFNTIVCLAETSSPASFGLYWKEGPGPITAENMDGHIAFEGLVLNSNDKFLFIDTKTGLVQGLDAYLNFTGNLYNKFISSANMTKLSPGLNTLDLAGNNAPAEFLKPEIGKAINYNYIYY